MFELVPIVQVPEFVTCAASPNDTEVKSPWVREPELVKPVPLMVELPSGIVPVLTIGWDVVSNVGLENSSRPGGNANVNEPTVGASVPVYRTVPLPVALCTPVTWLVVSDLISKVAPSAT
jgi:hypothetical protein